MTEERPWLKNYPSGVPANIDPSHYPTVVDFLEEVLKKYANKPMFECMGKTLTYSQIDKLSRQFGAYLQSRGLEPGDRIALMMPNLLQYPVALFGAIRAGLIIVNTNPLYTPREMKHQFVDSEVKAIVILENFAANLEKILPDTGIKIIITTSIGELIGGIKGRVINFAVRRIRRMVPKYSLPNTVTVNDALAQGKKFKLTIHKGKPEGVLLHQYTGGTTGVAKGAMLTNRNMVANMLQVKAEMAVLLEEGVEIALCALPLYHIFSFTVNCLCLMTYGAKNVLIPNARDINGLVKTMKKSDITVITGINTLFNALLNHKDFKEIDFSPLKITVAGGMALQMAVAEKWEEVTGCFLAEGYGMTESAPVASVNPMNGTGQLGTIGIPVPSTDMRIVDDEGNPLPPGQIGEIQIKGPQVMKGYYKRPEATANTIVDGWLNTGDIGIMNPDGYFKIVDRKKDMILVSGFNVYPNEIEDVIAAHPKVLEVAAIGIPHEKSGEVVKVFIVKKDNSLTDKEIVAYCREHLTGYKVPKAVEFRKDLPKTNVGKILRRKLKEETDQTA